MLVWAFGFIWENIFWCLVVVGLKSIYFNGIKVMVEIRDWVSEEW